MADKHTRAIIEAAVKALGAMEAVLLEDVGPEDAAAIDDLKHAVEAYEEEQA